MNQFKALRAAARQGAAARAVTVPAPIGGWDTQNAITDMPPQNAIRLDNWFPSTDRVTMRPGWTAWATGLPAAVETLLPYVSPTGTTKLFAASGTAIYDVTAGGVVGAAVLSSLSNARFQQVQVTTPGGNYLFICNGVTTPRTFDGSAWANTTITGPTVDNLAWCGLHQRRLWIGEANSLDAWYLGTNAIGGAATKFSLGAIARRGGYIIGMATWSRDSSGTGPNDYAVFITSEGELIVYAGTDPATASTWSLLSVMRIGRPIGRRCWIKAGGDVLLVTTDGLLSVEAVLSLDTTQQQRGAITQQINAAAINAAKLYGANFGWEAALYPKGRMLIFNVPVTGGSEQYVFNTLTRAPCRFTGINAQCWVMYGDNAYFGGNTVVGLFDSAASDNGTAIYADAIPAFATFGSAGRIKNFRMVEPLFQAAVKPIYALDLLIDYNTISTSVAPALTTGGASAWDSGRWDTATWTDVNTVWSGWRMARGIGRAATVRLRVSSATVTPAWLVTRYMATAGGPL